MKKKVLSILILLAWIPLVSNAALVTCDNVYISDVWVEGNRDDGFVLQNTMLIRIKDTGGVYTQCNGKDYFHLENTSQAFSGMLSIALTAQTTGKQVQISINTNQSTSNAYSYQIAYIRIKSN